MGTPIVSLIDGQVFSPTVLGINMNKAALNIQV